MLKTIRARKGVTLAEITVALALVSIMITLVVSFVITIASQTKANSAYDAMRRDCMLIESTAERWMKEAVARGYDIGNEQTEDSKIIKSSIKAEKLGLKFNIGTIIATFPEGDGSKQLTIRTETVESIEFEVLKNGTETMLICHITCVNPENGDEVKFNICVNPRVGEAVN